MKKIAPAKRAAMSFLRVDFMITLVISNNYFSNISNIPAASPTSIM